MNGEARWPISRPWITAIILSALLVGIGGGSTPVASGQGRRFECDVHRTKANEDPDWTAGGVIWTSPQQSLYGCEGWLYAMALRLQHTVYGKWGAAL